MNLLNITIQGRPAIKKNNQMIYGRGKKKWIGPNGKYRQWEKEMVKYLLQTAVVTGMPFDCVMELVVRFHFKNHQWEPDASNCVEGVQDALQKAGIIMNDKLIYKVVAEKVFDGEEYFEISLNALSLKDERSDQTT